MTAYEIAFGVVLIIVSVLIVVFTLSQTQKGQGLSAAIMDAKLAKVTKICGAVFFVATLLVGVLSARL